MSIVYKNIMEGGEVYLTSNQYEKHLADSKKFEEHFFCAFPDLIECYTVESYTNGTKLYDVKYRTVDKSFCVLWGALKNSGTEGKENKRMQVLPVVSLKDETPYFAIGAYDTIDTVLYTLIIGGVREFIKHAQNGTSYSSLWINYPSLWEVYKNDVYEWNDRTGRRILACKDSKVEVLHKAIIELLSSGNNDKKEVMGQEMSGDNVSLVDFTQELVKYKTDESLPRNPNYRDMALIRENYTCELCGTHKTFTDKNNVEYFEGHHLIMYNISVQSRFKYCLDHPDNIMCLCPNCHREIHHSSIQHTKDLLIKLFTKHNGLIKEFGIKSLDEIINDYTK